MFASSCRSTLYKIHLRKTTSDREQLETFEKSLVKTNKYYMMNEHYESDIKSAARMLGLTLNMDNKLLDTISQRTLFQTITFFSSI